MRTRRRQSSVLPGISRDSIVFAGCLIPFASKVKSLGVTLDSALSMKQQINTVCRACYFHIIEIFKIRKFLSQESVVKLVSCFVLSRLDYCHSLLADLPTESISKLQNVQNCATRLVLGIRKREHITPALKYLHWLPISQRIHYKLSLLCYKSFNSLLPSFLPDLLSPYTVSRILRSTSDTTRLFVPRYRLEHYGNCAFSRSAPSLWNSPPAVLCETNTTDSFKTHLKTHLFRSF